MNLRSFTTILLIVFVTALFPVHGAQVESTGLGFIKDGNLSEARQSAIEDAKRLAVEQLMGSFISARTETKNFMLASERIFATTQGRIDKFDILNEQKLDESTYQVTIKAYVNSAEVSQHAIDVINNNLWSKKPRIKLNISAGGANQYTDAAMFSVKAEVSQALAKQGFIVLDDTSVLDSSFEIKLNVSANVNSNDFQGTTINTSQLSVAGMLLNTATQTQITSVSYAEKKAGDVAKGLAAMASKISKRVAQKVNLETRVIWLSKLENPVLLNLSNLNQQQRSLIETQLQQAVIGLSGLTTENKTNNSYLLSATYTGWPEQLYDQLSQLSELDDISFTVESFANSTLTLSIK